MFVVEYIDDFKTHHMMTVDTISELKFLFERFDAQVFFKYSNFSSEQASSQFNDAKREFTMRRRFNKIDKCRC